MGGGGAWVGGCGRWLSLLGLWGAWVCFRMYLFAGGGGLIEGPEVLEVAEGAGELALEAEFELVYEGEGVAFPADGLEGEADFGGGIKVVERGIFFDFLAAHFEVDGGGLGELAAEHAPVGGDHDFDEAGFDGVDGLEAVVEVFAEGFEDGWVFIVD